MPAVRPIMVAGKRYIEHKVIFDLQTGVKLPCAIWWAPVWHPSYAYQLYVIKVRVRKKVWSLVTMEGIDFAAEVS